MKYMKFINTFDKLKLSTKINNISDLQEDAFLTTTNNGIVISHKFVQEHPFYVLILADMNHSELVIEFTGKVLLDDYPSLINSKTIRQCLQNINDIGVCRLNIDGILADAQVLKADVTKDVKVECNCDISDTIRRNLTDYKKWVVKEYPTDNGIVVENTVKTPRYKKRLTIYDKSKEIALGDNVEFLNALKDRQRVLSYFADKKRFELNINTKSGIRTLLNVPDNKLSTVLAATANPLLTVVDQAVRPITAAKGIGTIRDYEHSLLIKECENDMVAVEATLRHFYSCSQAVRRALQKYRDIANRAQNSQEDEDCYMNIRDMVA